jgi:hypothetical protein
MEAKREFAYEKFRRQIQCCSDVKELQELSCKFLRLYLAQQEMVDKMILKGWLPQPKTGS